MENPMKNWKWLVYFMENSMDDEPLGYPHDLGLSSVSPKNLQRCSALIILYIKLYHIIDSMWLYHIVPFFSNVFFFTIIKQIPWNPIKPHEKPCLYLYPIDWLLSWWKPIFIPLNPIVLYIYIYVLNPIYISHWLFFNPQQFIQFLR